MWLEKIAGVLLIWMFVVGLNVILAKAMDERGWRALRYGLKLGTATMGLLATFATGAYLITQAVNHGN